MKKTILIAEETFSVTGKAFLRREKTLFIKVKVSFAAATVLFRNKIILQITEKRKSASSTVYPLAGTVY
ncbi:MAG TPA: hypothetical protein VI757_13995 [Bacteroidia bacterium]|nr:hypothetical protein [Bacteroidia bacterium]